MFGPRAYVPVLKVKRAEKAALAAVSSSLRTSVVPLLEIVELKSGSDFQKHLDNSFHNLASSLAGYDRCLLDLWEIAPQGSGPALATFHRAAMEGVEFTPVTGISRTADLEAALAFYNQRGVGIRLTRDEFEHGQLTSELMAFIGSQSLDPERVDLIVDLGEVDNLISAGIATLAQDFLAEVPHHTLWNTLTITGSSFPRSMGVVSRNSSKNIERSEWVAWRDNLYSQRLSLDRLPTFSDCVIQHPSGVEGFDPTTMSVSACIRYAVNDNWLLNKGQSTKRVPPSVQFPELALRLVYGTLRSDFSGPTHCEGCRLVQDAADGASRLGSAEVWRKIGTIHHITTVVRDGLAQLMWP